ncbi:Transcriptional regulator, contains XRE-family HTH domain [Paenibacillus sp. UNCCL117]|uniref:helix-turn-helix domain-containing protein n=1 Tax=unclassified Paenibacillus TaxID=185978 RepID=UPI00087FE0C9|nr:Transcriptional regulator, contains XRE-family HTH domain [Paenibacillus sp. cl123]SFW66733.1 Transcriptional regulator, contains XRE-family HTH domain [Paenibacillus sp. UNCCL117]
MFGKRLAEVRTNKGLSQYELAERLGFSRAQIANYEQGTREPDFHTLIVFADFFEVSLDYLLGRTEIHEFNANGYQTYTRKELTEREEGFLEEALQVFRKYSSS